MATASAEALSDQRAAPGGLKKSCQNVLKGWSRCPIGTVAQEPAEVSIEVASEARTTGLLACAPEPTAGGAPQPETADTPSAARAITSVSKRHVGRDRSRVE